MRLGSDFDQIKVDRFLISTPVQATPYPLNCARSLQPLEPAP
jgi:hypothetical protein